MSEQTPNAEDLLKTLGLLRSEFLLASKTAPQTHGGSGSWWELHGYAEILKDAIERIRKGRARVERNDARLAGEMAGAVDRP